MKTFSRTNQFKKDVEHARKRGWNLMKLRAVLDLLIEGRLLPSEFKDHPLKGDWVGSRDCHIKPDWVLVYTLEKDHVRFERTGTHSDLFR